MNQKKFSSTWWRVSKTHPCEICKKIKWCTYSEDAFCCMRVASGKQMANGGWLHRPDGPRPELPERKPEPQVVIDACSIWKSWNAPMDKLKGFAAKLGVEPIALNYLGCVWSSGDNAWAFPMRDHCARIIGLRLRNEVGHKWAVKGSKSGLFFTRKLPMTKRIYIAEGPTDCAAGISMGLNMVGRPSCLGCEDMIGKYISINRIREVVIIADNDPPGLRGADKLQATLKVPSACVILPSKDLREFVNLGGNAITLESILKNLVWSNP